MNVKTSFTGIFVLVMGILPMITLCQQRVVTSQTFDRVAEFSERPPLPIARAGHAAGLVDGFVLVAGGNNWSTDRTIKSWLKDSLVYDLVYNPVETRLVKEARSQGVKAAGGLGMLVEQAALSFQHWTGMSAPREVMMEAANEE